MLRVRGLAPISFRFAELTTGNSFLAVNATQTLPPGTTTPTLDIEPNSTITVGSNVFSFNLGTVIDLTKVNTLALADGETFEINGTTFELHAGTTTGLLPDFNVAVPFTPGDSISTFGTNIQNAVQGALGGTGVTATFTDHRVGILGVANTGTNLSLFINFNAVSGQNSGPGDAINIAVDSTAAQVATAIELAINGAHVRGLGASVNGSQVTLTGPGSTDLTATSPITTDGLPNGGQAPLTGLAVLPSGQMFAVSSVGGFYSVSGFGSRGQTTGLPQDTAGARW